MASMRRSLVVTTAVVALSGAAAVYAGAAAPSGSATLTWFGQSMFLLESAAGTRIVMDPIPKGIGYDPPAALAADAVTVSHEHADHNNVALVAGKPKVLRGLTADKKGWTKIVDKVKEIAVRSVGVYHDGKKGAERGLNTVFVFDVGNLRVAHLGDLGHLLDDKQLDAIGVVDVLLVPVGGFYTIDGQTAGRVVDQLRPRLVVIPMHYKTDVLTIKELSSVDGFLAGRPRVRVEAGRSLALGAVKRGPSPEIVVLGYK